MRVQIENHNGRLRLRWQYQGKKYTMAAGVPESPTGRAFANQLKATIELDVQAGYFDTTLLKYRPRKLGANKSEVTVVELFEAYTRSVKRKGISANGLQKYSALQNHLLDHFGEKSPAESLGTRKAGEFVDHLLTLMASGTAKQYIFLLRGCWEWAQGKYHIADNPWAEKVGKIKPHDSKRVKPFNETEIKAILSGFESSRHYSHYYPVVRFLFATAVRPGEAFGLRWRSVADDFSHVVIREAVSRGKKRATTKTGKNRVIYVPLSIAEMLRTMHQERKPSPDALIFPSPMGKPLSDHNFSRRAWRSVLESVGVEYRSPYAVRHSAISHALRNGADPVALSEQTGHSPKTMLGIYAHAVETKSLFPEF